MAVVGIALAEGQDIQIAAADVLDMEVEDHGTGSLAAVEVAVEAAVAAAAEVVVVGEIRRTAHILLALCPANATQVG